FYKAEDGIRDLYVTGVQTCALPIFPDSEVCSTETVPEWSCTILLTIAKPKPVPLVLPKLTKASKSVSRIVSGIPGPLSRTRISRSEERRVGKYDRFGIYAYIYTICD